MRIRELAVSGAFEITPRQLGDSRGLFLESYRVEPWIDLLGEAPVWKQANTSVSQRGVVRGIHYGLPALGQAKYVTAMHGVALDYVVDLRRDSTTFGHWDVVKLDSADRRAVYIPAGFGHAFEALTNDTTIHYLLTEVYTPESEFAINLFDEAVGLRFQTPRADMVLSERDRSAPSLLDSLEQAEL